MTTQTLNIGTTTQANISNRLQTWLSAIGSKFSTWLEQHGRTRGRLDQIEALEAMSDAQLAQMGVPRDRIAQHVFRDMMGV